MDQGTDDREREDRRGPSGQDMGTGVAVGAGVGLALNNLALGLGAGVAIGAAIWATFGRRGG